MTRQLAYYAQEFGPKEVASAVWHQGIVEKKRYHSANGFMLGQIKTENLIIFGSASEAEAHGFKPSHYAGANRDRNNQAKKSEEQ